MHITKPVRSIDYSLNSAIDVIDTARGLIVGIMNIVVCCTTNIEFFCPVLSSGNKIVL